MLGQGPPRPRERAGGGAVARAHRAFSLRAADGQRDQHPGLGQAGEERDGGGHPLADHRARLLGLDGQRRA
eukprot:14911670-Alexandrium_andersonii.AAC.1